MRSEDSVPNHRCREILMADVDLDARSTPALLRLHAAVIDELKSRGVVRTKNNPVGDYAEWLVSQALGLALQDNSAAGYDATSEDGVRYQIKARRVTPDNRSRQLSAIRKLDAADFDRLIGVIFNAQFEVTDAYEIPHEVIAEYSRYRSHTNAHVLHLQGSLLQDSRVTDIADRLRSPRCRPVKSPNRQSLR